MKTLFVAPDRPSPVRVRPYYFTRSLATRGHNVTLACPPAAPGETCREAERGLNDVSYLDVAARPGTRFRSLASAALRGIPLQARYAWDPALGERIQQHVTVARQQGRPFDVCHVEHLRGSAYAVRLRADLPVVWDSVDCISLLFGGALRYSVSLRGRLMAAVDLPRTRRYEGWLMTQFDHVIVTSPTDRDALLALADRARLRRRGSRTAPTVLPSAVSVIPNGVDVTYWQRPTRQRSTDAIVMTGKLSYHANITAARYLIDDIMPHVWNRRPTTRVILAGAEPSREVRALAHRHPTRVTVTGYCDDLRPHLHTAAVAVAPLVYAVGIQNKVLEAMACATPVVASGVAVQALSALDGRDVVVGSDAADMAEHIVDLLDDPARATAIGAAGRAYVERHHRWDDSVASLETVYEAAIRHAHDIRGLPIATA